MSRKKKRKKHKQSSRSKRQTKKNIPSRKLPFHINGEPKVITYFNMGNAFFHQGQLDDAISCYRKALELKPDYSEAHYEMGNALLDKANLSEAISCYQRLVDLSPRHYSGYYNMGIAFQEQGNLDKAISCFHKALDLKPDHPGAYNNMGIAFQDQGKLDDAVSCFHKAIQIRPDDAGAHYNMGTAFQGQAKLVEAIDCYRKALKINPQQAEAHNNLGVALGDQGEQNQAISCFQKAVQLKPDYAEAYNNMGNAFRCQGNSDQAMSFYEKALELKPDYAEAYRNMGIAFEVQHKLDKAFSCYQQALELKPDLAEAYCPLVHQLQQSCAWQRLEDLSARLDGLTKEALYDRTKPVESPFVNLTRHADPAHNFAVAKACSSNIARAMSSLEIDFSFDSRRSYETKIAVGYLSSDFRDHPVAHLMLSLFGLHNRDEFKILTYSYGEDDESYCRKRIQQDCDKFIDVRHLSHAEAAKCIYEDRIDILVDLTGYTGGGRLEIFALRPAPVQVSYLGFPGTTGADFFDYIITDRLVTPEDQAIYYSENFVYMPHCYMVCDNTQEISNRHWKKVDFGLPEDGFVFCSFNSPYKIEPVIFDVWMQILHQVPKSVLWLREVGHTAKSNLRREAEKRGISSERLTFSDRLPSKAEHLARLSLADLALDTRIYNGHATTSDALWAGVPVIALKGNHFASRASASLLTAIGLSELIIDSLEEYKELAVRLAHNPDELEAIRERLSENRLKEPLFDTPQFVRDLERAYKAMWDIFLVGESPRRIELGCTNEKLHFSEKRSCTRIDTGSSEQLVRAVGHFGMQQYYFQEDLLSPDDVFLASYPRSGSHLVRFIIMSAIYYKNNDQLPGDFLKMRELPDIHRWNIDTPLRPRIIKTHFPFDPRYIRVIHLVRDPRDTLLSYYHYTKNIPELFFSGVSKKLSLNEFIQIALSDELWPCDLRFHTPSFTDNSSGIEYIQLRYEAFLTDPHLEMTRLLKFLNIDVSQQVIEQIANHSTFGSMSRLFNQQDTLSRRTLNAGQMLRKGKIGSYKEEMAPEIIGLIESAYKEYFARYGYARG